MYIIMNHSGYVKNKTLYFCLLLSPLIVSLCWRITNQLRYRIWEKNFISVLRQRHWLEPTPQRKTSNGKLSLSHMQYSLVDATQWCISRSEVSHSLSEGKKTVQKRMKSEWWKTQAQFVREKIQITFRCGSTWLRQEALSYFTSNEAALFFPVEVNLPLLLSEYSCQQSLLWNNSS